MILCLRLAEEILAVKVLSNLKVKPKKRADLQVVQKPDVKTTKYSDINLKKWKDYAHILTGTLWQFPTRLKAHGHSNEYHGNYIPQIAQQNPCKRIANECTKYWITFQLFRLYRIFKRQ